MRVRIRAHKGIGLAIQLGKNRLEVPAGGEHEAYLPGDQIGIIMDSIAQQARTERLAPNMFGGGVDVLEADYDAVPPGSKKWLRQVKDGEIRPRREDIVHAAIALRIASEKAARKAKPEDLLRSMGVLGDEDEEVALEDVPPAKPPKASASAKESASVETPVTEPAQKGGKK